MVVPASFTGPRREGLAHAASPLAQRINLGRFFGPRRKGCYEAVRTLLEELKRKSLPSSFALHVTLGQTTITMTKNISIDSLLTRILGTRKLKAWSAELSSPTFLGFRYWLPLLTRQASCVGTALAETRSGTKSARKQTLPA
jgi:hypothetical protein